MAPRFLVSLFFLLIISLGLRLWGITFDSLWLDESYQSLVDAFAVPLPDFAKMPAAPFIFSFSEPQSLNTLLANFRNVDPLCPPLYPVLLNRWISVFGNSDFAIRSLSVVFSELALIALFCFTKRLFGLKAAIMAGFIMTISPFDIYYAQEARMYSLIACTALISCFSLIMLVLTKQKKLGLLALALLYCLASWALINTHYTGLFVLAFQGIFTFLVMALTRNWRVLALVILSWAGIFILWLPWLPMFFQAAAVRTAAFYVAREPSLWWPFKALFIEIPINWLEFLSGKKVMVFAIPIYFTSALFLFWAAVATISEYKEKKEIKTILGHLSIWLWALLPALALWAIDTIECHRVIEIARYVTMTAPAIYVLAGLGLANIELGNNMKAAILAIHTCFALANNIYAHVIHQREPWREMAQRVEEICRLDDIIFVSQPYDIVCLDRYLTKPYRQVGVSANMGKEYISNLVGNAQQFVLITAQEGEQVKDFFPENFKVTKQIDLSHGLHLRFYSQ